MDGKEKYYTCNTRDIIHVTLDGWERKVLYM